MVAVSVQVDEVVHAAGIIRSMTDAVRLPDHIDTLLLDLDGTLLDLAFDTHFWLEVVPALLRARARLSAQEALEQEIRRACARPRAPSTGTASTTGRACSSSISRPSRRPTRAHRLAARRAGFPAPPARGGRQAGAGHQLASGNAAHQGREGGHCGRSSTPSTARISSARRRNTPSSGCACASGWATTCNARRSSMTIPGCWTPPATPASRYRSR